MLSSSSKRSETCISDLVFDEWSAGEVSGEQARALENHVSGCERCAARRQAFAEQARGFLERAPHFEAPRSRPRRQLRFSARQVAAFTTAVAVAATALVLVVRPKPGPEPDGVVRSKGGPQLGFFVKHREQIHEGSPGERVEPGDQLRFLVRLRAPKHVAVLSRDARGKASVYYPAGSSTRLVGPAPERALESSVELDDTLGRERIYGVFCDEPIALEALRAELEQSGKLSLLPSCTEEVIEIVKDRSQ